MLCQEDDERLDLMQKHLCCSLSNFKFQLTSFQKSPFLDFLQPRFSTEDSEKKVGTGFLPVEIPVSQTNNTFLIYINQQLTAAAAHYSTALSS